MNVAERMEGRGKGVEAGTELEGKEASRAVKRRRLQG